MTTQICETCGRRLFFSENLICHPCAKQEQRKDIRVRADTERRWHRMKEQELWLEALEARKRG